MEKKYRKSKRYYYYRKQRIYGLIIVALGVLSAVITGWDFTAAFILIPLGLYVGFTKNRVIMDDYFFEMEAKKFDNWKEP